MDRFRTKSDRRNQPGSPTMSVPAAGKKYFGLGRNASYAAASRGEIPSVRIGSRLFAVVSALDKLVGVEPRQHSAQPRDHQGESASRRTAD